MPVGRTGWEWTRARHAAASEAGRGWIFRTAILVVVIAAISASAGGCAAAPGSTPSSGAVAAGTASHAPQTPQLTSSVTPQLTPSATPTLAVITPSATSVDADDEAGVSSVPGASFSPGPTGVPLKTTAPGSPAPGSTADRLPGEPDPVLTPGALNPAVTQATIGSTICVSGWTATIRPPSSYTGALKIEQIAQYGYTDTSTSDYEEDHLISLELGGAPTDPRNLWPEPYTASLSDGRPTGAHTKDGLETKLKNEVCSGAILLATAQAEIGDHWVHAYYGIQLALSTPTAGPSATPEASAQPSSKPSAQPSTSSGAALSVRITSLPASIKHGANATLVAVTSPGATCTASVTYASGTVSSAKGLQTEPSAGSSGKVSWTWKVGTSTKPGVSSAEVTCQFGASSASTSRSFRVT
jgi:hypothetical protein